MSEENNKKKRIIEPANIDDLNISIETKILKQDKETNTTGAGRPPKFINKLNNRVHIFLSNGQLEAIDNKTKEIGFSARQDYFRKLLRADIPNFDEL